MSFIMFLLGVATTAIFYEGTRALKLFGAFKQVELLFLFAALNLVQYKYHAIKILEISYMDEIEKNPDKKKELEQIISKIHSKFDSYGDSFVERLQKSLPYKTAYNDWKTAMLYAQELITKEKLQTHPDETQL